MRVHLWNVVCSKCKQPTQIEAIGFTSSGTICLNTHCDPCKRDGGVLIDWQEAIGDCMAKETNLTLAEFSPSIQ